MSVAQGIERRVQGIRRVILIDAEVTQNDGQTTGRRETVDQVPSS